MLKRIGTTLLVSVSALALLLAGCDKKDVELDKAPVKKDAPAKKDVAKKDAPEVKKDVAAAKPAPKPGTIPFDYPVVETKAQAGDFVLCPPRQWIDRGFAKGGSKTTFIYYGAKMLEPGKENSKVKRLSGTDMVVPNAMIVAIRKGETAQPGDIILTRWQSGSGMQRAIVVEGGTPTEPKIRYLDIDYDNPSGAGKKVDICKPDTFHKIGKEFEVGTAVVAKGKFGWKRSKIVGVAGDKILGLGFAGRVSVLNKADCVAMPVKPEVKVGDNVYVPYAGTMKKGVVKKVDAAIGRVFAEIEFGGKKKETAAPFGDVITSLPEK